MRQARTAAERLTVHAAGQNPLVIGVFLAGAVVSGVAWLWFARWLGV